jgi:hypothetical protein
MAKKLTKAQVKAKLTSMMRTHRTLMVDKMDHGSDSFVPMSMPSQIKVAEMLQRTKNKIK